MAAQKPFLAKEGFSSSLVSEVEPEFLHPPPAQATEAPEEGEPLTPLAMPNQQPEQEGGRAASASVVTGAVVTPVTKKPLPPDPAPAGGLPQTQPQQPMSKEGRSVYAYPNPEPAHNRNIDTLPPHTHDGNDDVDPQKQEIRVKKIASKKSKIFSLSMACLIVVVAGAGIAFFVAGWEISKNRELDVDTSLTESLQSDTILLYQGSTHSTISITESVPPSKQKPDISLFVVDCNDLIQRNISLEISNRTLLFTSNIAVPIPSQRLHYEIGSVIEFIVKVLSATDGSKFSVLIFDNITQANDYAPSQNPDIRKQAIKDWSIATNVSNETTTLCFKPSNGGYFVPVFDIETSGRLVIEYSYQIRQVFYQHTDYEPYTNCSLVVEMCSLNLKESDSQTETCILAYNPRSVEAYQGPTTLQTDVEIEKHKSPNPRCRLCIASYVVMGMSILATCACLVCAVKCCIVNITTKKSSSSEDDLALNPPQ